MAVSELVIIGESLLKSISKDQRYLQAFPFLSGVNVVGKVKSNCNCGDKRVTSTENYNVVKQQIASMSKDNKRLLKSMLGASKVQVTYSRGKSNIVTLKF